MRLLYATLLLVCGYATGFAAGPPGWDTDYRLALQTTRSNGQPVLLYFTASWCGPCKLMARSTLTNQAVTTALASLAHAVIDIDEHAQFAAERGVQGVPAFQMLSPGGDLVDSVLGFQEAASFAGWLTNATQMARESALNAAALAERLAKTGRLLKQADPAERQQALTALFDLCGEPNAAVQVGVAGELKHLAQTRPRALLDGLAHPRLATRIQVANLLRDQLGEGFDIDPWSGPDERARDIKLWQGKLQDGQAESPR